MKIVSSCNKENVEADVDNEDTANSTQINCTISGKENLSCVAYVRCRIPKLPTGLTYYDAKQKIADKNLSLQAGYAVVMPAGKGYETYGHIAYVKSVNADGTITIEETNWEPAGKGKYGTRTKKPTDFKVYGYYKP
jgi:CHAP domain